jgi:phosphoribosylformimino-5-aminoimidazole carboxamide ribotide isomerase
MAAKFPGRIALGLDARDSMVATEGWLDVAQTPALDLAGQYADLDLACVIYTNIARDGMMQGIDDATIDDLVRIAELGLPVVASGGVSRIDDIERLARASRGHPRIIGAIVGRALYENALTVPDAIAAAEAQ